MPKYETGYGSKTVLLSKQNNTKHQTLLAGNSYFISDCFTSNQRQRRFERRGESSTLNLGFTCTLRMYVCTYVGIFIRTYVCMYVCMCISVFQQRNYHRGRDHMNVCGGAKHFSIRT